jgi:hypothetical protein
MTARLISNPQLWAEHLDAGRRDAVCNWFQANGLDPLAVLSTHDTIIEPAPGGGRQIRCMVTENDDAVPELRVVPLVVPPPPDWPVHAVPSTSTVSS